MRLLRIVPWLLAVVGLAVPLSQSPYLWPFVLLWAVAIGIAWLAGRAVGTTRMQRMAAAAILLPVLLVPLAWWGGWWLIPADLAWLLLESLDRDADERRVESVA